MKKILFLSMLYACIMVGAEVKRYEDENIIIYHKTYTQRDRNITESATFYKQEGSYSASRDIEINLTTLFTILDKREKRNTFDRLKFEYLDQQRKKDQSSQ